MPAKKAATKKAPTKRATSKKVEVEDESTGEVKEVKVSTNLSLSEVVKEVLDGKWGYGQERRVLLSQAGYSHNEVQKEIVRLRNQT